jgi:hypothetical protein
MWTNESIKSSLIMFSETTEFTQNPFKAFNQKKEKKKKHFVEMIAQLLSNQ